MHDAPRRLRIRPYAQPDAAPTLAVFIAAVTRTAAADYDPAQIRAWVGRRSGTRPAGISA
ncbi:GNAT family protein [Leucobacter soli]|uniref:hypothetical protein n=1 Tax=Leucobacter soli TaxID=2812850 RepID=UPI003618C5B1